MRNFKYKGNFHDLGDQIKVEKIRIDTKEDSDDENANGQLSQAFAQKLGQYKINQQKRLF